jgi:hypothetical protein
MDHYVLEDARRMVTDRQAQLVDGTSQTVYTASRNDMQPVVFYPVYDSS